MLPDAWQCQPCVCCIVEWISENIYSDILTLREEFCWKVVGACCQNVDSLCQHNIEQHSTIIQTLLQIYYTFCKKQVSEKNEIVDLCSCMPEITEKSPCVKTYFEWVHRIQQEVKCWNCQFSELRVNYDEVMLMKTNWSKLSSIAHLSCYENQLLTIEIVNKADVLFHEHFRQLNELLLFSTSDSWSVSIIVHCVFVMYIYINNIFIKLMYLYVHGIPLHVTYTMALLGTALFKC